MLAASTVLAAFVAVDGGTASVAATGQRVSNAKGAVVWEVDESKKVITVTVKMAFSLVSSRFTQPGMLEKKLGDLLCGTGDRRSDDCKYGNVVKEVVEISRPERQGSVDRAIQRIGQSIKAGWDGRAFACYELKVQLATRFVQSASMVRSDEIHIRLDDAVVPHAADPQRLIFLVEGFVMSEGETDYLSDKPENRGDPITGPSGASKWPLSAPGNIYQHEFGHILGLDDNYDPSGKSKVPRPGAVQDLMFNQRDFGLSWQSVARAVRRSGLDIDKMGCAWRYTILSSYIFPPPNARLGMSVILCKVPLPSADPRERLPLRSEKYVGELSGSVDFGAFGGGRGAGPISGEYYVRDRGNDVWEFSILFDPQLSVRQRARLADDKLVAVGWATMPEAGSLGFILGPEPYFLPLYNNPPECG